MRCDTGCRRPAVTWWVHDRDDDIDHADLEGWHFCGPCIALHAPALTASGYEERATARDDETAPST